MCPFTVLPFVEAVPTPLPCYAGERGASNG